MQRYGGERMRLVQGIEINWVYSIEEFEFSCSKKLGRWIGAISWKHYVSYSGKWTVIFKVCMRKFLKLYISSQKLHFLVQKQCWKEIFTKHRCAKKVIVNPINFMILNILIIFQAFYEYKHKCIFKRKQSLYYKYLLLCNSPFSKHFWINQFP